jgi:predicted helicase
VPFPGGVLTDTFQTSEDSDTMDQSVFTANSERVRRQNEQPITVIIANPPYSAWQKSANENNANDHYETLDGRIMERMRQLQGLLIKDNFTILTSVRSAGPRTGSRALIVRARVS